MARSCPGAGRGARASLLLLAPALTLPLGGCCNLARYFCGPDTSEWVQQDYSSPDRALRTVLEAVRRADSFVLFESMSQGFKARSQAQGSFEAAIALERLREEFPGFHLLGSAEVSEPALFPPEGIHDRARYGLEVSGYRFTVDLVREPSWQVRWIEADGHVAAEGGTVTRAEMLRMFEPGAQQDEILETWAIQPRAFAPRQIQTLRTTPPDARNLERFEVVYRWKLDDLRPTPEDDPDTDA